MRAVLTSLLLFALPVAGVAQGVRPFERPAPVPTPTIPTFAAPEPSSTGVTGQLLRFFVGAAVGAWVGYMASQVAVGDWEDDPGINRGNWAVSGAALGITLGFALPGDRPPPARATSASAAERAPGRDVLTAEQLEQVRSGNLYGVIRSLRPEWLRTRGTGSMRETARGTASGTDEFEIDVRPGIPTIRVYLDDSLVGDVDSLRTMDPGMVGEVRFLSAAEATHRYGAGHIHGAILVLTASVK